MRVAVAGRVVAHEQRLQAVVGGDHQAAVEQRHLDVPALAGALALEQRGQDRLRRVHAGEHVDRRHAELERRPAASSPLSAISPASPCTTRS